jgi:hypothetical protein
MKILKELTGRGKPYSLVYFDINELTRKKEASLMLLENKGRPQLLQWQKYISAGARMMLKVQN